MMTTCEVVLFSLSCLFVPRLIGEVWVRVDPYFRKKKVGDG